VRNPLSSEDAAFRFLIQFLAVAAAIAAVILIVRALS
jgi:hypothetical protein